MHHPGTSCPIHAETVHTEQHSTAAALSHRRLHRAQPSVAATVPPQADAEHSAPGARHSAAVRFRVTHTAEEDKGVGDGAYVRLRVSLEEHGALGVLGLALAHV